MTVRIKTFSFVLVAAVLAASGLGARVALAAAENFVDQDAEAALQSLYSTSSAAKTLSEQAKGILVFPIIGKGGFIVGIQGGDGVLFQNGAAVATTVLPPFQWAIKPASNRTVTRCSS